MSPPHSLLKWSAFHRVPRWLFGLICLLAFISQILTGSAVAQDRFSDEAYLAGLRSRQLYRLAETYCREQLARQDLNAEARRDLVIELSRTLAAHAVESIPGEAEPLWEQATKTVDDYARQFPKDDPRSLLARVQKSLVMLARGELLRRQSEVVLNNAQWLQQARDQLGQAAAQLEALRREVEQLQRQGAALPPGAPTGDALFALGVNLDYEISRAYRNLGHCYPPQSADRSDSLLQATERLKLLARRPVEEPKAWQSRLDEVSCYRLLEDYRRAHTLLGQLESLKPPGWVQLQIQAEKVRLALDAKLFDDAVKLADAGRGIDGQTAPQLDFARLEAYLGAAKAAEAQQNENRTKTLQQKASQLVRIIRQQHTPYWARRAETLEARHVAGAVGVGGDLDALLRAAENLYRNGQLVEAVTAYDNLIKQGLEQGKAVPVFDWAFTAGAVEFEAKHYDEALRRFRTLALADHWKQHPQAPRAHLAAIGAALAAAQQTEPLDLTTYVTLLEEHLRLFPNSPSTGEVHWRLAEFFEREGKWVEAANHYSRVPVDHERFGIAVHGLERCFNAHLADLKDEGRAADAPKLAAEWAEWFERQIKGNRNTWPERWSQTQRDCALAAARFWVREGVDRFDHAQEVLSAALVESGDAPKEWKTDAQGLLILSLAAQGNVSQALETLNRFAADDIDVLLRMLSKLQQIAEGSPQEARAKLAQLQLAAAARLEPKRAQLNKQHQKLLDMTAAAALVASGQQAQGLARYQALADAWPDDAKVQTELATVLLASNDPQAIDVALRKWRTIERRSKPGSSRWFAARYQQAVAFQKLGRKNDARQFIELTRTLHPELGGAEMKLKFDQLLKRL